MIETTTRIGATTEKIGTVSFHRKMVVKARLTTCPMGFRPRMKYSNAAVRSTDRRAADSSCTGNQ